MMREVNSPLTPGRVLVIEVMVSPAAKACVECQEAGQLSFGIRKMSVFVRLLDSILTSLFRPSTVGDGTAAEHLWKASTMPVVPRLAEDHPSPFAQSRDWRPASLPVKLEW